MPATQEAQQNNDVLSVIVTGDATLDSIISRTDTTADGDAVWSQHNNAQAYLRRGGALLLDDVIQAVGKKLCEQEGIPFNVLKKDDDDYPKTLDDAKKFHHSFSVWSLFNYDNNSSNKRKVWRVEEFSGLHKSADAGLKIVTENGKAKIVVYDDANLGFRDKEDLWNLLAINDETWILLKMASPIAEGKLWEKLYEKYADRLIVSLTIDDLRLTNVQVSRELSWELTAQDLLRVLINTPSINSLFNCAHVIVSFGTTGAVLLSRNERKAGSHKFAARLIYDPNLIEGMWRQNHPGRMSGYNICITTSLALALMRNHKTPNIEQGVKDGLAAMRRLHLEGYIKEHENVKHPDLIFPTDLIVAELCHPFFSLKDYKNPLDLMQKLADKDKTLFDDIYSRLSDEAKDCIAKQQINEAFLKSLSDSLNEMLKSGRSVYDGERIKEINLREKTRELLNQNPTGNDLICLNRMLLEDAYPKEINPFNSELKGTYFAIDIPLPFQETIYKQNRQAKSWRILEVLCLDGLDSKARDVVLSGAEKALQGIPLGKFGKLLTVDKREIESLRSIRTLVNEYSKKENNKKPISIAVFGSPGSGKSFGIEQMADALLPGRIKKLTFNLSQFSSTQSLWDAMHQVRDVSLSEKLPLVFWDEFDTTFEDKPLGWLKYFLAPMQDGEFQDGQITHPIGRAIFVFAGGTAEKLDDFLSGKNRKVSFAEVKGPDFVSRLKGFVDILGPNQIKSFTASQIESDAYYVIRRAVLLRSIFDREASNLFDKKTNKLQIDEGVLRALLETKEYKHGVRSMESVIVMSLLKGKQKFERSSLPSEAQLNLHVDAKNFMEIVNRINLTDDLLNDIAREVHKTYQEAYETRESDRKSYDKIPHDEKEQNKSFANDIPNKLAKIDCSMMPLRGKKRVFRFKQKEIESLAKIEHERWLRGKLKEGWRYSPVKNKPKKEHDGMLLWEKLSEREQAPLYSPEELEALNWGESFLTEYYKKIDRYLVERIPRMLEKANHAIVRNSLVIGVTGHRFLKEEDKINKGIEEALRYIEDNFLYHSLTVMSSLAEGADRLVVKCVLNQEIDAKFIVPLPLPEADYEKDFKTEESKQEFRKLLGRAERIPVYNGIETDPPDQAYEAAGNYILDNCDVLIAIWDGQKANGTGGTGEIVSRAHDRKIPIIWIRADKRNPDTEEPVSSNEQQGWLLEMTVMLPQDSI